MELQRNTQSLIAHASAARAGAAGTQTEGGAPEAAALLLWPSVRATQVRAAAAEISSLKSRLDASQGGTRLLLQWLLARMSPQQMDAASRLGLLDVIAMDGDALPDAEELLILLQKVDQYDGTQSPAPSDEGGDAATDRDATAADGLAAYRPPKDPWAPSAAAPAPAADNPFGGSVPAAAPAPSEENPFGSSVEVEGSADPEAAAAQNHQRKTRCQTTECH